MAPERTGDAPRGGTVCPAPAARDRHGYAGKNRDARGAPSESRISAQYPQFTASSTDPAARRTASPKQPLEERNWKLTRKRIPPAPPGVGLAGAELWQSVLSTFVLDSEPHKLAILAQACKVASTIEQLEAAQVGEPLTVLGSARQQVISPLIDQARQQRALLASLLGKLGLPDDYEDEEAAAAAEARVRRAKKAAAARWGSRYGGGLA